MGLNIMNDNILISNNAKVLLHKTLEKIDGAYAPTTIRAYKADFAKFIEFCESRGESALPALPISIAREHLHNPPTQSGR